MDPLLNDLLTKLGMPAALLAIQAVIKAWERKKKKKLSAADKKQIADAAQGMIQLATMDDVRKYSPAYHRISAIAVKNSARSAAKRVAARKAAVAVGSKKVSAKWVVKKAVAKRVAPKTPTGDKGGR